MKVPEISKKILNNNNITDTFLRTIGAIRLHIK